MKLSIFRLVELKVDGGCRVTGLLHLSCAKGYQQRQLSIVQIFNEVWFESENYPETLTNKNRLLRFQKMTLLVSFLT